MKITLVSEIDDRNQTHKGASEISKNISELLKDRFSSSKAKNLDGNIYVYLYFNYPSDNPNFHKNKNGLFIGKDDSIDTYIETASFYTTSSCAISAKVNIIENIESIFVFYSLHEVKKEELFPKKNTNEESSVQYTASIPQYSFEDVIINKNEERAIKRALTIIKDRDLIFSNWGYSKIDPATKSILCFHGAPGTGKTMCAHAVATLLGKKILIASYAQIQSKYTGEGEKNIRAYFKAAEDQDAVLFIDEADTFLSKRLPSSNANSKIYNSMSNELYQLIENHNGCIIFASNHITDFDPAVISRIIEPIEFKIPDKDSRIKIIKKLLPPHIPFANSLTDKDYEYLSDISEGFSGRDIRKSVLVFIADKVYIDKYVNNTPEDSILFSVKDIAKGFNEVKSGKKKLEASIKNDNEKVSDFIKKEETNLKLLNAAALALWSDGIVTEFERTVFKELCSEYKLHVNINDRENLMKIDKICSCMTTKKDKAETLDLVCRMVSIDGELEATEITFVKDVALRLGLGESSLDDIDKYLSTLLEAYKMHKNISNSFSSSEYDTLNELRIEYTEPAALFHMSEFYKYGNIQYGITVNKMKELEYLEKARHAGYNC